ncbi:hypothetical protein H1164_08505 [Thermoactinomyces daqus]|uniref:Uncharacterized protein n=1 Tax=Thermoactinomyces daqus TaxID=1329516 RepID=A0A7W1XA61_9BACL|nr:hypothetical protein [Thermoactinomyces daqus]MBA4542942.1 hypothetical protein [Thermoactinomyces daqus]
MPKKAFTCKEHKGNADFVELAVDAVVQYVNDQIEQNVLVANDVKIESSRKLKFKNHIAKFDTESKIFYNKKGM